MPLSPRQTNIGIPLHSQFKGGESDTVREIPPEWRAALDILVVETPVPYDTSVVDLTSGILAIKREQKFTSEATLRQTSTDTDLPATLVEYGTDKNKEIVTRTRNFRFIDDLPFIAVPSALRDVNTKNFGNLHFEETIEDVGDLFVHAVFEESITDPVPPRFKALFPISTTEASSVGVAADPTLAVGDLSLREEQTDVFVKRETHSFHDLSSLPQALAEYKLTPDQQIETIIATLDTTFPVIVPDELTVELDIEQIAGGMYVTTLGTVPDVFAHTEGETSIPDLIPPEFRGILPLRSLATTFAGTVDPTPVLDPGELSRKEEQLTEFKMRRTATSRDPNALPATLTSYKLTKDKQVETILATLDTGLQTITGVDELTVEAEVQNLGNNLSLLKVGTVPSLFEAVLGETSIPDLIPQEFRGILPLRLEASTLAGTADPTPTLLSGELSRREEQLDEFTLRRTTTSRDPDSLPATLTSYKLTKDKQVETVVATLDTGLQTITGVDELTIEAEVQNLGNNLSLLKIGTVASLFENVLGETSIPDLIPQEFRGILPLRLEASTLAGTADPTPTLLTGELSRKEEQLDEFTIRRTTTSRDTASLPATLTNYKLTRDKQIATVVATLDDTAQTLTGLIDELTTEAEVLTLGAGLTLKRLGSVDSLFAATVASVEVPDLVPQEFRAFIPTFVEEVTEVGLVEDPPVLSTGDLEKTETQLDVFTKRVRVKGRAGVVLPVSFFNTELTEEFGGGVVQKIMTLDLTGYLTSDTGLTVLQSTVTDLGNGTSLKVTSKLVDDAWPILLSTHIDEKYYLEVDIQKQVVDAGTVGGVDDAQTIREVKSIDKWRSLQITSKFNVDLLPGPRTWFSGQRHSFPPELLDAVIDWAEGTCGCSDSFSAVLLANFDQYTGFVKTRITEQFFPATPPDDVVIDQFFPQSHNFGFAWASACGDVDGNCRTKSGAPNFHIPLCLHDALSLSVGANTWTFPATTPAILPHGSYIMLPPHIERWRFGVFRRVLTEVLVP